MCSRPFKNKRKCGREKVANVVFMLSRKAVFKKRRNIPGSSPATLIPHLVDGEARSAKITTIEFDQNHCSEREFKTVAEVLAVLREDRITWINLDGLGDLAVLEAIAAHFGIHPLALEDVLNTGQRPKVEDASNYLFIIAQMIYHDDKVELRAEQVAFFLFKNVLITIQEEPDFDVFEHVRERLRAGRGMIRKSKTDYLAYALLDSIIDHYYPVLEQIGTQIEDLENQLLERPTRDMVKSLHDHKRGLSQLRRFVWPMRDVINSLLHDHSVFVTAPTKIYLRDCYDHTVQLMDFVESYREVSAGLMELYHSSVSLRTNEVMRVLTVITSVFIPLTFIAGLYGMNFSPHTEDGKKLPFNMPELYQPHGYVVVLVVMALIATGQLYLFRRMKWL
jgi:magnesium transporter